MPTVADDPQGRAVALDDCGHGAGLDPVEEFHAALREFLRDLGPP